MIVTFNNRVDRTKGGLYFEKDFQRGIAQEAGLSMPTWFEGSEVLLTSNPATFADFSALIANRHPRSCERLTLRDKTTRIENGEELPNRRLDFELTFSCPKTVSIMAVLTGDRRILTICENVVWSVLIFMVRFAATRVRKNGADRNRLTNHLLALLLYDVVSREGDPHLHAHVAIPNVTWDPVEECYKALQFGLIHKNLPLLELWAKASMMHELQKIGYEMEGNEIKGVLPKICQTFSKSADKIQKAVAKKEIKRNAKLSPAQKKVTALGIRSRKQTYDYQFLLSGWRLELGSDLKSLDSVYQTATSLVGVEITRPDAVTAATQTLEKALEYFAQEAFTVSDEQILVECFKRAAGEWTGPNLVTALHRLKHSGKIRAFNDSGTFASEETYNRMAEMAGAVFSTKNVAAPILNSFISVPQRQKALAQLMTARDPLVVIGTNMSPECLAMTRTVINTFAGGASYCIPTGAVGSDKFRLPRVLERLDQNNADSGKILIVVQAEKLSMAELELIVFQATSGRRRAILIASQQALQNSNDNRPLPALNRLSWLHQIVFTPPKKPKAGKWQTKKSRTFARLAKDLFRRDKDTVALLDKKCDPILSVAIPSVALLTEHRRPESVAILTDDSNQIARLNGVISHLLQKEQHESTYGITTYEVIPYLKNLSRGDTLIAPVKTRHFKQGDVLVVEAINDKGGILSLPNGERKQFARKVLQKLKRIKKIPLELRVGMILEITEPLPPLKIHAGDRIRIESIDPCGNITIQNGNKLPPWFRFFRLGYSTQIKAKRRWKVTAALVVLSKRPSKQWMEAINKLADDTNGNLRIIALSPKALPAGMVSSLRSKPDLTHEQMRAFQLAQPIQDIFTEPKIEPVAEPPPMLVAAAAKPAIAVRQPRRTEPEQPTIEII